MAGKGNAESLAEHERLARYVRHCNTEYRSGGPFLALSRCREVRPPIFRIMGSWGGPILVEFEIPWSTIDARDYSIAANYLSIWSIVTDRGQ